MSIETARSFFLWCSVINYGLLAFWGLLAIFGRGWLHGLSGRVWRVTPEQCDLVNLGGITLYKMGIFLFNLVPLISLYLIK